MQKKSYLKKTAGFTMVELLVVLAIIAVLMIFGVPWVRGIITGAKVQPTGGDLNNVVAKLRSNFAGQGNTPYNNLGSAAAATAVFANTARGLTSALTVTGTGAAATLQHDIGATNSQITAAAASITVLGDSFSVTVPTVNDAACPGLATQMSRSAEVITVNGANVKTAGGVYNGGTAGNACTVGDTNSYVFTFR